MSSWLLFIPLILMAANLFKKYFRFYYLVFKLPGPRLSSFSFAGITNLITKQKDVYSVATEIISSNPPVFRIFLGPYVHIITSRPQDIEIICNNFLEKGKVYHTLRDVMGNSLLVANLKEWKKNRKFANTSFNYKVISSFADIFTKQAKVLVKNFGGVYGTGNKDLRDIIWFYTLRSSYETIADIHPDENNIEALIYLVKRGEEIYVERLHTPWLNIKAIWNKSRLCKELTALNKQAEKYLQNVLHTVKNNNLNSVTTDPVRKLLFLNNLFSGFQKGFISNDSLYSETKLMMTASSETTASALSFVLIALGIYPDIQDIVYQELISTLGDANELTVDKIRQLQYLDRVIKETLRMKAVAPYIGRKLDKDVFCEPFIFPAGCDVIIPIDNLHKNPEIWKDPLKFDPDRFLPEEVEKRHHCAYIPFSHGTRNCIGFKYAMLSVKCMVVEIVRNFRIKTLHPKEFADVEVVFTIISSPKNYSIEFTKRQ